MRTEVRSMDPPLFSNPTSTTAFAVSCEEDCRGSQYIFLVILKKDQMSNGTYTNGAHVQLQIHGWIAIVGYPGNTRRLKVLPETVQKDCFRRCSSQQFYRVSGERSECDPHEVHCIDIVPFNSRVFYPDIGFATRKDAASVYIPCSCTRIRSLIQPRE